MRAEKAFRNILYDYIGNILTVIISFVSKTVFIYTLGQEYLGLSGLFSNVLSVLSLAELGIGSAITFELYKPLAENNNKAIQQLMQFYKKAYQIIGWVIAGIGIIIIPILKYIVNFDEDVAINYIAIYVLFLINSVFSYLFFAYKATILYASQKKYLTKKIEYKATIIQTLLQVIVLFVFHNYYIYLIIGIVRSIIQNFLVAQKADTLYPILKEATRKSLPKQTKDKIRENTIALSLYKVSGVVLNATDNIVISTFISTTVLASYSLYNYLSITIKGFWAIIFDSFVAAIGDFNVVEENKRKKEIFDVLYYLSFILYGLASIGLIQASSDFIQLWVGKQYLLSQRTLWLMTGAFLIAGLENATYVFRTGCGLYDIAKYRPVCSTIVNVVVSVILANFIGIDGVFIGTIISRLVTYWIVDPKVVYKYILCCSVKDYYTKWFQYISVTVITVAISQMLNNLIPSVNWVFLILKVCYGEMIFITLIVAIYWNKNENKYLLKTIKRLLKR